MRLNLRAHQLFVNLYQTEDEVEDYGDQKENRVWSIVYAKDVRLESEDKIFEAKADLKFAQLELYETRRLNKQILNIPEPSEVTVKLWPVNSPTMDSDQMKVDIAFGGKPTMLFDPKYINELAKYLRDVADEEAPDVYQHIFRLYREQKNSS